MISGILLAVRTIASTPACQEFDRAFLTRSISLSDTLIKSFTTSDHSVTKTNENRVFSLKLAPISNNPSPPDYFQAHSLGSIYRESVGNLMMRPCAS